MEPLLMGFLGGLCGSIPLAMCIATLQNRMYFSKQVTGLKRLVDRLVMPLSMQEWKESELKFYEFRELIYSDSRDFLSGR